MIKMKIELKNNLETKIIEGTDVIDFFKLRLDTILLPYSMNIINFNKRTSFVKSFTIPTKIIMDGPISLHDSVTNSIYFIKLRKSNHITYTKDIKIKKIIARGWNNETGWFLPF